MKILKTMLILMVALLPMQVLAAPIMQYDGTNVRISGVTECGTNKPVTVIITRPASDGSLRPNSEFIGETSLSELTNAIEYIGIIVPETDGTLNHTIKLSENLSTGFCGVYYNQLGDNTLRTISDEQGNMFFDHINSVDIRNLIDSFNPDSADYSLILSDENLAMLSKVQVETALYTGLLNKSDFHAILKNYRPFDGVNDVIGFKNSFHEAIALAQLKTDPRATLKNEAYLNKYWTIDISAGDFAQLSPEVQEAILAEVASHSFIKASDVDAFIKEKVGLNVFSQCLQRTDIDNFLKNYSTVFCLETLTDDSGDVLPAINSFEGYGKSRILGSILLSKSKVTDKLTLQEEYKKAIVSEMNYDSGSDSGSSSSSGTSGSSSSSKPSVKIEVKTDTDAPYKIMSFYDVGKTHWAYSYIDELYKMGAISGRSNGSFGPEDTVKREEVVKMLCGVINIAPIAEDTVFSDIDANAWYAPYIAAAVQAKLISGVGGKKFGIGNALSRQDAAVILCRAASLNAEGIPDFADVDDISEYARGSVAAVSAAGLINGYEDGTFGGKKTVTRAEISAMLCRLAKMKGE